MGTKPLLTAIWHKCRRLEAVDVCWAAALCDLRVILSLGCPPHPQEDQACCRLDSSSSGVQADASQSRLSLCDHEGDFRVFPETASHLTVHKVLHT